MRSVRPRAFAAFHVAAHCVADACAVRAQELLHEGGAALLSTATLERALVARLEAPPAEARDTPFQYLLGCVSSRPRSRELASAVFI